MVMRTGVWILGARGGLATTVVVGACALRRGLASRTAMATDLDLFAGLPFADVGELVFGGHEVRGGDLVESAREIAHANGSLRLEWIAALESDLREVDARIRTGTCLNSGAAIERLAAEHAAMGGTSLREQIGAIQRDLRAFRAENGLDRVVVVNLASTEPPLRPAAEHESLAALEQALDANRVEATRPSLLYSYAALDLGHPYVNFTPSDAALVPAIVELAERRGAPFMGSDGKTGETLVKSVLAPVFRARALHVLAWVGYNLLGDRDGQVLADSENLASKVRSKDRALAAILGYAPHTHVGIDFVPSLHDLKTAWDFIHFEGFLGHRMAMQFIWQGCDAILAAPLVLDLVRLADLAQRLGERGPMHHLACFFKSPFEVDEHDFHRQWEMLRAYAERCTARLRTHGSPDG